MNSFTQVQYIKLFTKTKHNQSDSPLVGDQEQFEETRNMITYWMAQSKKKIDKIFGPDYLNKSSMELDVYINWVDTGIFITNFCDFNFGSTYFFKCLMLHFVFNSIPSSCVRGTTPLSEMSWTSYRTTIN
jgi:hypothetical protein